VVERPAPNISIVSVRVNPTSVYTGDSFTLYATVQNAGNARGYLDYEVVIAGSRVTTGSVAVDPGGPYEYNFGSWTAPSSPGSYSVCVNMLGQRVA
jgi:hypothetical protein